MAEMQKTLVNGIDVEQLKRNIGELRQDPTLAQFKLRTRNHWQGAGHNESVISGFYGIGKEQTHSEAFHVRCDEPKALVGEDTQASPVEYLLHALAGCVTNSISYHAAVQGIAIESMDSTLEGDMDMQGFLGLSPTAERGYQRIRVTMEIKSDASAEQLKELAEFSPVYSTLKKSVPVDLEIKKVG